MLGEALLQTGQAAEAEAVLERALQSLPATVDRRQSLMMLTEVERSRSAGRRCSRLSIS